MPLYQISWAIKTIAEQLAPHYQSKAEATRIAREIIGKVMGIEPTALIMSINQYIDTSTWECILRMANEHSIDEKPLAYILEAHPFLDLVLQVTPPILIPRPETEWWSNKLINLLRKKIGKNLNLKILDLCTGSGCIALALADAFPQSHITGIDINPDAIRCAQQNAKMNTINNATFLQSDLFSNITNQKFDLIVANPPYISKNDYAQLEKSVRKWEDPNALWAEQEGTALIREIVRQSPQYLTNRLTQIISRIWIEIGYNQATLALQLSTKTLPLSIMHDQFEHVRLLIESKPDTE